jgi:hypothetical protein
MMNNTNGSLPTDEEQTTRRFAYYGVCVVVFFIAPMLTFNIFLMVSVCVEKAIPLAIRFILCNILAASDVVLLGLGIFFMALIILSAQHHLVQSDFVCRLMYTTLAVGSSSRLILMPTFAIVVVTVVRHGIARIRILPTIGSVIFLWLLSTLPNLAVFSPQIWLFRSSNCFLYATGAASIMYTFAYITVYGICGVLITAVSTTLEIVYVKRNTTSQDRSVLKNMVKFATFLLLGNTISFIGISVILLIGAFAPTGMRSKEMDLALNYAGGITLMCSLIPLPILLLVFFKPIRIRFHSLLCLTCYKVKDKITSSASAVSTVGKGNNA